MPLLPTVTSRFSKALRPSARLVFMLACVSLFASGRALALEGAPAPGGTSRGVTRDGDERAASGDAPAVGSDESVYVVQRRAYSKRGAFELTPAFFASVNNKYVSHLGGALAVAYHLRENFAVEATSSVPYLVHGTYSALIYEVRRLKLEPTGAVSLKQMSYFATLALQYSALYGKATLFENLIDYDFYVTAGTAFVSTVEVCQPQGTSPDPGCGGLMPIIEYGTRTPPTAADAYKIGGSVGGGARIFFSNHFGLRIEVRDIVYADRTLIVRRSTAIRNNVLGFIGLSVLL